MLAKTLSDILGSQQLSNALLLLTLVVALLIGYRQIALNDIVEIYSISKDRRTLDATTCNETFSPILQLQNVGTRLVYIEKYIFNGREYITNGQILPSSYSQSDGVYLIDLPTNGENHVSVTLYYRDVDGRRWSSVITADRLDGIWKTATYPREPQK